MRIFHICCFLVFFPPVLSVNAQTEGAVIAALGGAGTALAGSVWDINGNPAGLAAITRMECSWTVVPAPFGLTELRTSAAAVSCPFGKLAAGALCERFGFDLFRRESAAFCVASEFDRVRAGLLVRFLRFDIARYGSACTVGIDAGFQIHAGHSVTFGARMTGVNHPAIGVVRDPLPGSCALGCSYVPADIAIVTAEYVKEIGFDAAPRFGAEYRPENLFACRIGVSGNPPLLCAGCGFAARGWSFDYAYQSHADLGATQLFTLTASFGR